MSNPFDNKHDHKQVNSNQSAESIKLHNRDDVDSGSGAHHHTLGPGPNQAAPGNHTHSGGGGWQTGDIKCTYAEADNVEWFELNGQPSPTPELTAMFGANLPDVRDRYLHAGNTTGSRLVGALGGGFFYTIGTSHLPPHTHTITHTHAGAAHTHSMAHNHDIGHNHTIDRGSGTGSAPGRVAKGTTTSPDTVNINAFAGNSGGSSAGDTGAASAGDTGASSAANTGNGGFANNALIIVPPHFSVRVLVHT
jgi:hypothetical protein